MKNFEWTTSSIQNLQYLWEQTTLTTSEIAEQISRHLTKNSVIGKAHRLKLRPRRSYSALRFGPKARSTRPARVPTAFELRPDVEERIRKIFADNGLGER